MRLSGNAAHYDSLINTGTEELPSVVLSTGILRPGASFTLFHPHRVQMLTRPVFPSTWLSFPPQ